MKTLGDIYAKSCTGKREHATKRAAELEAQRMSRLEREPFICYHCELCGKWHTAHQRKNDKDTESKIRNRH